MVKKKNMINKYDYNLVNYINKGTKIQIKCNTCKIIFEQSPSGHLKSKDGGCIQCSKNLHKKNS